MPSPPGSKVDTRVGDRKSSLLAETSGKSHGQPVETETDGTETDGTETDGTETDRTDGTDGMDLTDGTDGADRRTQRDATGRTKRTEENTLLYNRCDGWTDGSQRRMDAMDGRHMDDPTDRQTGGWVNGQAGGRADGHWANCF